MKTPIWYVSNDRCGGVLVAVPTKSEARDAVNFGGTAGREVCRLARPNDRAWSYGVTTPCQRVDNLTSTLNADYARRRYHVPADIPVLVELPLPHAVEDAQ